MAVDIFYRLLGMGISIREGGERLGRASEIGADQVLREGLTR